MTTYKRVHIKCDRVVCRGEFLGDIDIYANVKIPGECHNYKEPGLGDNWFIEMYVIKSNTSKIEQGYTYLKQIDDGLAKAKITFIECEEIDVTDKIVWIMSEKTSEMLAELIADSTEFESEEFDTYYNNEGIITLIHKEA
jgi:hypothetical protein